MGIAVSETAAGMFQAVFFVRSSGRNVDFAVQWYKIIARGMHRIHTLGEGILFGMLKPGPRSRVLRRILTETECLIIRLSLLIKEAREISLNLITPLLSPPFRSAFLSYHILRPTFPLYISSFIFTTYHNVISHQEHTCLWGDRQYRTSPH